MSEPILLVGAGAAGLALGHALQQRGIQPVLLERHSIGWAWRNHYERLHLHTLKQVSGLPGLPMPADYPAFPTALDVARYLEQYAAHFGLAVRCNTTVEQAQSTPDGWTLHTSQGIMHSRLLAMTTGIWSRPVIPALPGRELFQGLQLHAADYRSPQPFLGQRVLVVGSGNTGAEIATDLAQHGVVTAIAVRNGITMVPKPTSPTLMRGGSWLLRHLPRPLANSALRRLRGDFSALGLPPLPGDPIDAYPVVGFDLAAMVRQGQIAVRPALAALTAAGARFVDGSEWVGDAIIFATGYRPALQAVAHALELDAAGRPRLDGWRSVRNPRLFCVGYTYPTVEGWLQSIGRHASAAADAIAAALSQQLAP